MGILALSLPGITSSSSLPVVPNEDIRYLDDELATDAYDHWIFDRPNASALVGKVNGKLLTPQSVDPIFGSNNVSIFRGTGKALLSDVPESANQTQIMVVKPFTGAATNVFAGTRTTGVDGSALYIAQSTKFVHANQAPAASELVLSQAIPDQYLFVALAEGAHRIMFIGGLGYVEDDPVGKTLSDKPLTIGCGYAFATDDSFTHKVSEYIIYQRTLALIEIQRAYARSIVLMRNRQVDLLTP